MDTTQALPTASRVVNALVLHARAPEDLLRGLLWRMSTRGTWAADPAKAAPAIYVVGTLGPRLAHLVGMARAFAYPSDDELAEALVFFATEAGHAAVLHAEGDHESQACWARGSLGDWIGASYPALHPRQREVLGLLVLGLERQQIAGALGFSIHTVDHHVRVIRGAIGVSVDDVATTLREVLGVTPTRHMAIRAPIADMPVSLSGTTPKLGIPFIESP